MAYKVDKPEVNSDNKRLEQWANMTSDDLMFALNDLERQINNTTPQYLVNDKTTIEIDSAVIEDSKHAVSGGAVYTALETKVDKVIGKDLSTNDYTDSEKTKLSNIEAGAEVNVQSDWNESDNTSDDYIKNKPTKVSDFTNDSGFITNTVNNLVNYYLKSETYTKTEVDNIATAIKNSRFEFVNSLPTTDIKTNVIYLVPKNPTQTNNYKDEYINRDGTTSGWEKIGDTEIDLTNYYTRTDTDGLLNNKVDKVTGKQLSTEDYTTAEKTKLSGIEDGAEVNVIEDVKVNGTSQQVTNKSVDLSIPSTLSDLSDDNTHRVVTDTEKTTWDGKSVVTANPTTTSSDPNLNSLGINGTNYNIQGGGSGGGHDYDVSMNANKDEMTLSEDNVAKTTLPLVTEYIGTRANWNNLSASQQAKYRRVTFLGEGGNNNYQLSHIGMVIHSTTLNSELLVQEIYGSDTHWVQHTGYFLRGATSGVVANQLQEDGGADTHTLTIAEMPSHKHNFKSVNYGWEAPTLYGAADSASGSNIGLSPYNAYYGSDNGVNMLNTGGGQPHNNVPKYKNVYIWERVS